MTDQDHFSTETAGLTDVGRPQVIQVADGDCVPRTAGSMRRPRRL
jgi:hypothetical protein